MFYISLLLIIFGVSGTTGALTMRKKLDAIGVFVALVCGAFALWGAWILWNNCGC